MAAMDSGMEGRKLHANMSSESIFHDIDLVSEILRRLPSKSVMRSKSVCKSWRALIISRYFCLLWRQHHQRHPGILLRSLITDRKHSYVPLSGPTAGVPQFELPRDVHHWVLQSCNGFLLHMKHQANNYLIRDYWVYNPATLEVVHLPWLRMDTCKIHARRCKCFMGRPVLAFDSHSRGRVVALLERERRRTYQVCVTENQGPWRISGEPFKSDPLSVGVHWRNFIVWLNSEWTLFYDVDKVDVGGEGLRRCASPHFSLNHDPYLLGESGGHLHFVHDQGSRLIISEMKHDLSGWFVKHNIGLSQIEASLFRSIGWDQTDGKFNVNCLIEEEKERTMLVLGCHDNAVLYRIQDNKSWKLCEWEFSREKFWWSDQSYFVDQHVSTISCFL